MPRPEIAPECLYPLDLDQFHRLVEDGAFAEGERVELIDGVLRRMSPIGPQHRGATDRLAMCLTPPLVGRAIVSVQGPLVLDEYTEVYPDLLVLEPRPDWYARSHPRPCDVLLLVEIADSSLRLDLGSKLARYARAGIARYWVLDLGGRTLYDHWAPGPTAGCYRALEAMQAGTLSVRIAGTEIQVAVAELFPG